MPEFNRFDVCEAYYTFATLYHGGQWSEEYAIFGRLNDMGFNPSLTVREQGKQGLSPNGRRILANLIRKHREHERSM